MEYYFTHLMCKNFRGLIDFNCSFNENYNEINGENGVGKTTVLSAILWCIFGKDLEDRKSFPITPIINGQEQQEMTTIVELTINDNFVIERTWDGTKTELKYGFVGVDGKKNMVKSTQTNFNKVLNEKFVQEDEFKALSNINYLPNLHWEKLKTFIYELIGEVKDEEVLANGSFPLCEPFIKNLGFMALVQNLKETKQMVNEDINRYENEINYATQLKIKYLSEKDEIENMKVIKANLEQQLLEYNINSNKVMELKKQKYEIDTNINQVWYKIKSIEEFVKNQATMIDNLKQKYVFCNPSIESYRNEELRQLQVKENSIMYQISVAKKTNEHNGNILVDLKEQGERLKAKEIKVEKETCSVCGAKLSDKVIETTLNNLKEKHLQELNEIKTNYDKFKEIVNKTNQDIALLENELDKCRSEMEFVKTKTYDIPNEETNEQKNIKEQISNIEMQIAKNTNEKENLLVELEKLKEKHESIVWVEPTPPFEIQRQLNEINEKLATSITLEKLEQEIEDKKKQYNAKIDEKDLIYRKEQELVMFSELKGNLLKQRISKYFNLVEFITIKQRKDGSYEQCFELSYKGIPYAELNSAHKIKVAIDLVMGIQKLKNKKIPILIDSIEVITDLPSYETQVIATRSIKQDIPKLMVNGREIC